MVMQNLQALYAAGPRQRHIGLAFSKYTVQADSDVVKGQTLTLVNCDSPGQHEGDLQSRSQRLGGLDAASLM